jgi:hypothetical protein
MKLFRLALLFISAVAAGCRSAPTAASGGCFEARRALGELVALVDGKFTGAVGALEAVAASDEARSLDFERVKPLLAAVQRRFGPGGGLLGRADGTYFTVDKGRADQSIADRGYFTQAMSGRVSVGELIVSRTSGQASAVVAAPVVKDGRPIGIVGCVVFLEPLRQETARALDLPADHAFFALDTAGRVALHSDAERLLEEPMKLGSPALAEAVRTMLETESGSVSYVFPDVPRTAVYRTSPLTGWKLAIRSPGDGAR